MPLTRGWVLKSWSMSWAEVVASRYSRSMTKPMLTRSSPVFSSFIGYSQVPPIWPYFAGSLTGHGPIVWMIRSSGLGTFQTSLTPSSQTWGSRPSARPNSLIAAPVRWPQLPSARTVARARAYDAAILDDQLRSRGLGEDVRPALFGLALLIARQRGHRDDLVTVVLERRRWRDPKLRLAVGKHVDGFLLDFAEREVLLAPILARQLGKQLLERTGTHHGAREV